MIIKYKKVQDEYTTHTLIEPDYKDGDDRATELCTIDDFTYVNVPASVTLPVQPANIQASVTQVVLTDELKEQIKKLSPHIQLSYARLQERIRARYSADDETYFTRISIGALAGTYTMASDEPGLISAYQDWVEECREIARVERSGLGL